MSFRFVQPPPPLLLPFYPLSSVSSAMLVARGEGCPGCAFPPLHLSWVDGTGALPRRSRLLKGGRLQSATVVTLPPVLSSLSFVSAHCRLSAPAFLRWCYFSLVYFQPVDYRLSPLLLGIALSGATLFWCSFIRICGIK